MSRRCGTAVLCLHLLFGVSAGAQEPSPPPAQQQLPSQPAQSNPAKLNINVVEGAGAVNNIRTRAAREFTVEVDDENDHPVSGAVVTFLAPNEGPGGSFAGDTQLLTVMTDKDGRAIAGSFRPNNSVGDYNIQVTATLGEETGSATISQSNRALAVAAAKHSNKTVLILVAVGAAVAIGAGVGLAGHGSSSSSGASSTTPTATLGLGSGATVSGPH
ncbi:MAG: hypothetical protein JO340_06460 [Acidobacteriaceae bacterium]|nr:hypothetical protein [Acidobacteriaceae bacterium]